MNCKNIDRYFDVLDRLLYRLLLLALAGVGAWHLILGR
jgi:hypothetical protein